MMYLVHFIPNKLQLSVTQCQHISTLDLNRGTFFVVSLNNTSDLKFVKEAFSAPQSTPCSFSVAPRIIKRPR